VTEAPVSSPAAAFAGRDGDLLMSRTVSPAIISVIASTSAMTSCSAKIWAGSSSTGAAASVAPQPGRPYLRSSVYTRTATARPMRCCKATTSTSERSGLSSHKNTE
jgi:hypothetical protein